MRVLRFLGWSVVLGLLYQMALGVAGVSFAFGGMALARRVPWALTPMLLLAFAGFLLAGLAVGYESARLTGAGRSAGLGPGLAAAVGFAVPQGIHPDPTAPAYLLPLLGAMLAVPCLVGSFAYARRARRLPPGDAPSSPISRVTETFAAVLAPFLVLAAVGLVLTGAYRACPMFVKPQPLATGPAEIALLAATGAALLAVLCFWLRFARRAGGGAPTHMAAAATFVLFLCLPLLLCPRTLSRDRGFLAIVVILMLSFGVFYAGYHWKRSAPVAPPDGAEKES